MLVNELLNTKAKIEVTEDTSTYQRYESTIKGKIIAFSASKEDPPGDEDDDWETVWDVDFGEFDPKTGFMTFSKTNKGDQFEIFSMVKQCIEMLIKKKDPENIVFTADKTEAKENRADLYERFLKRFTPSGYKYKRFKEVKVDKFVLFKD